MFDRKPTGLPLGRAAVGPRQNLHGRLAVDDGSRLKDDAIRKVLAIQALHRA